LLRKRWKGGNTAVVQSDRLAVKGPTVWEGVVHVFNLDGHPSPDFSKVPRHLILGRRSAGVE
jgi:hypothetical protein